MFIQIRLKSHRVELTPFRCRNIMWLLLFWINILIPNMCRGIICTQKKDKTWIQTKLFQRWWFYTPYGMLYHHTFVLGAYKIILQVYPVTYHTQLHTRGTTSHLPVAQDKMTNSLHHIKQTVFNGPLYEWHIWETTQMSLILDYYQLKKFLYICPMALKTYVLSGPMKNP